MVHIMYLNRIMSHRLCNLCFEFYLHDTNICSSAQDRVSPTKMGTIFPEELNKANNLFIETSLKSFPGV